MIDARQSLSHVSSCNIMRYNGLYDCGVRETLLDSRQELCYRDICQRKKGPRDCPRALNSWQAYEAPTNAYRRKQYTHKP